MKRLIVFDLDGTYGMADDRIGVARLDLPEDLPPEEALETDNGAIRATH
jgi:hypothetical protein